MQKIVSCCFQIIFVRFDTANVYAFFKTAIEIAVFLQFFVIHQPKTPLSKHLFWEGDVYFS